MSFLYPLFLIAALAAAIPLLIHLFNLRRYKTIAFPHTVFLKNIHLRSQKQSQLRYKWLLAMRIAFLLLLVLAFAQPFLKSADQSKPEEALQVIYLDNSASMSVKKGARTVFEIARELAKSQLRQAPAGSSFLILTNDKPMSYQSVSADRALALLNETEISPASRTAPQLFSTVQGLMESEAMQRAIIYYYSDFQKNNFPSKPDANGMKNIHLVAVPVRTNTPGNVYIDTAVLNSPVLQTGQSNELIVTSRYAGKLPEEAPVIQLMINGQVKSAASVQFNERGESTDTLSFQVNESGWQRMSVVINDALRFDDTFRVAARSNSNLSVLVLNEHQPNPFIQAAFRAYQGFRLDNRQIDEPADLKPYNLIILNGLTRMDETLGRQLSEALSKGQSLAVFPGRTGNIATIREALSRLAPVQVIAMDTQAQVATSLQQGSDLVKGVFDRIPDNVQLPQANWHYKLKAELNANQQSIISFRNGDPLLAQYTPSQGKLYILTTAADLQSGNFPGSYFFAPFLYQMMAQSQSGNVFATTAGSEQPFFISFRNTGEQSMVHLQGYGHDIIPPQRPNGAGLDVYAGREQLQAGFYTLAAPGNDSVTVAVNEDRRESSLDLWDIATLRQQWKGKDIRWMEPNEPLRLPGSFTGFPLWKVCVILALIMLAVETWLLASNYRKTSSVPNVHSHPTG